MMFYAIIFLHVLLLDGIAGDLHVKLSIFSGRIDPEWTVRSNDTKYQEVKGLLKDATQKGLVYHPDGMPARLGYRGFLVKDMRLMSEQLIVGPETMKLQQTLLQTIPEELLPKANIQVIGEEIKLGAAKVDYRGKRSKRFSPRYQPRYWNNNNLRRRCNNCYDYATGAKTGKYAQPGYGSGAIYTKHSFYGLRDAVVRDGLEVEVKNEHLPGPKEHLIALVVDPDLRNGYRGDFHFYRKDRNGNWSHKPGPGRVTRTDNRGRYITNPKGPGCDRGRYGTFVAFLKCVHYKYRIGGIYCPP